MESSLLKIFNGNLKGTAICCQLTSHYYIWEKKKLFSTLPPNFLFHTIFFFIKIFFFLIFQNDWNLNKRTINE
ncbi:hypothetical protein RIR_jg9398.t1 [Rhizophagus irregularis DAOM 181602=DAOM 197198]|nr:hypothetical protein RIR_jg9398.t1 [Rhizophagus irregularis DAOM 181602=DAOM 197198]